MNKFKKIRNSKYGSLFKLNNTKNFTIQNINTLFGIEKNYNKNIIKWTISYFDKNIIEEIEEEILNIYNLENKSDFELKSKLDLRKNYKPLLISSLDRKIYDILQHDEGEIVNNDSIFKNKKYHVDFIVNYFSISKNFLHVKIEIKKIRNA